MIDYLVKEENDETLLRAYQISYAALQGISFADYKRRLSLQNSGDKPTQTQVFEKVERIIDGYKWEEV